jgi:hypothetical protein
MFSKVTPSTPNLVRKESEIAWSIKAVVFSSFSKVP